MLGEVERGMSAEIHRIRHEAESNAAQYVSQEVFEHHYDKAAHHYRILASLLQPYVYLDMAASPDIMAKAVEAWTNEFGDLEDPAVKQEIDAFLATHEKEMKELEDAREGRLPVQRERSPDEPERTIW